MGANVFLRLVLYEYRTKSNWASSILKSVVHQQADLDLTTRIYDATHSSESSTSRPILIKILESEMCLTQSNLMFNPARPLIFALKRQKRYHGFSTVVQVVV